MTKLINIPNIEVLYKLIQHFLCPKWLGTLGGDGASKSLSPSPPSGLNHGNRYF